MPEIPPLTVQQYCHRLAELCLRSNLDSIPKKELDRHILLKSAALLLDPSHAYSEKEVTEKLELWVREVCKIQHFDRVSLRRWMVDSAYLIRSRDGAVYQAANPRPELFDPSIDHLDIVEIVASARGEFTRRKQEYMNKAKIN
jgi:hypothetical protein